MKSGSLGRLWQITVAAAALGFGLGIFGYERMPETTIYISLIAGTLAAATILAVVAYCSRRKKGKSGKNDTA